MLTLYGIIIDMDLRELRERNMLTQREVAERARITVTTLSRIENGRVTASYRTVRSLAEVFDMTPQEMREIIGSAQLPLWTGGVAQETTRR